MDLHTQTSTSNHYEVSLSTRLQSLCLLHPNPYLTTPSFYCLLGYSGTSYNSSERSHRAHVYNVSDFEFIGPLQALRGRTTQKTQVTLSLCTGLLVLLRMRKLYGHKKKHCCYIVVWRYRIRGRVFTEPLSIAACVYYLATAVSVAQQFLHGQNTP
jgi:hypothetical protein